jgi:hypothetical protein
MIIISDFGMEITTIVIDQANVISLTSDVIAMVIIEGIVIINLDLRIDRWRSEFSSRFRRLESIDILIDVSDAPLSSGKLLWRHVF